MADKFRRLLPQNFTQITNSRHTPAEVYDLLTDLFAQERKRTPDDAYLDYHGTPGAIFHRVHTINWYADALPVQGKMLDWGCNQATDSCAIRAMLGDSIDLYGCDFITDDRYTAFHAAANLHYTQLKENFILPYGSNTFDCIIAAGALEHTAIDYLSLQELYRILKPEAKLIITHLPNSKSISEWRYEHVLHKGFHMRSYKLSSIRNMLKHNGFFPVKWGYQTFFWERMLAKTGFRHAPKLAQLLYFIIPVHLISGCIQIIAVKKQSM